MDIPLERIDALLPSACDVLTAAANGVGWSEENPTWGHCAAAALLVQRLYGGTLLRVDLAGTEFSDARSHYYNKLPNGDLYDGTERQFCGRLRVFAMPCEERDRSYVISGADTRVRYAKFAVQVMRRLFRDDMPTLFDDERYLACLEQAYLSPCKKAGFGAMVTEHGEHGGRTMLATNAPVASMADLCADECIRLGIAPRTHSMIGACDHAEERVMDLARTSGLDLEECDMYVAGIRASGLPLIKDAPSHTCIRCARQIERAKLRRVLVPMSHGWAGLTPYEAVVTAKSCMFGGASG